jgi:hypothetical protein
LHLPTPRRQLDFGCRPGHFDEPQIEKNSCVWSLSQSFKYRYEVQNRSSLVPLKTVKTDKKPVQIQISKFRIFFQKSQFIVRYIDKSPSTVVTSKLGPIFHGSDKQPSTRSSAACFASRASPSSSRFPSHPTSLVATPQSETRSEQVQTVGSAKANTLNKREHKREMTLS